MTPLTSPAAASSLVAFTLPIILLEAWLPRDYYTGVCRTGFVHDEIREEAGMSSSGSHELLDIETIPENASSGRSMQGKHYRGSASHV
jgi:hypothetical protein